LLALTGLVLAIATPVFAYTYTALIQVQETNGTTYTNLPISADIGNTYLADNGYIAGTGLDTRVEAGGVAIPHMLTTDEVWFADSIAASSTSNFYYTLGNSLLADFNVITGYNGYVYADDDATLELGDNGEVEVEGYIDTDINGFIVHKPNAFAIAVTNTDEITAGIISDYTFSYGTEKVAEPDTTQNHIVCRLDDDRYVAAWLDSFGDLKTAVVTRSGKEVTWGAIYSVSNDLDSGAKVGVCKVDTDKVVYIYGDNTSSDGIVRAASISSSTITFGGEAVFDATGDVENVGICEIGTDKFAVIWNDEGSGDVGKVNVGTVSGIVITIGAGDEEVFEDLIKNCNICPLDTDKYFVIYQDDTDADKCKACAFTVSGTTTTVGAIKEIEADDSSYTACCQLNVDKVAIMFKDLSVANLDYTAICTISGTTITVGAIQSIGNDSCKGFGVCRVSGYSYITSYLNAATDGVLRYNFIDGTTVTLGTESIFDANMSNYSDICLLGDRTIGIGYEGAGDDTYAIAGYYGVISWDKSAVATGITSDEMKITVTMDTADLTIEIDDVLEDTTALAGSSMADNALDWYFHNNASSPYFTYCTIDDAGVEHLQFNPDIIIVGDTMPDESGTGNTGTIVWGSNPSGISATVGYLISANAPVPTTPDTELPTQDILPTTPQTTGFMTTPITTNTTHALYPIMKVLSDESGLPLGVTWILVLTVPIIALISIGSLKYLKNQFLTMGLLGAAMLAFWQMGIYPFWIPLIFGIVAASIVIYERVSQV